MKQKKEFRRLLMLNAHYIKARIDLALLLLSDGNYSEALNQLDITLSDGYNAKAMYYKAITLHLCKKNKLAISALRLVKKGGDSIYDKKAILLEKEWQSN